MTLKITRYNTLTTTNSEINERKKVSSCNKSLQNVSVLTLIRHSSSHTEHLKEWCRQCQPFPLPPLRDII